MFRTFFGARLPRLALHTLLLALPLLAQAAGRADQKQAMQIESDALRYEEGNQRSISRAACA